MNVNAIVNGINGITPEPELVVEPLPPPITTHDPATSRERVTLMTITDRWTLAQDLNISRKKRIEFMLDLHQRILYIEAALDRMAEGVGNQPPFMG